MKKLLFIIFTISLNATINAQAYIEKIANETCECIGVSEKPLSKEEYNAKLGFCIIESATPYKKKLKKDFEIDMLQIEKHGKELGELIGIQMVTSCPNIILEIAKVNNEFEDTTEIINNEKTIEGKITKIEKKQFVVFSLKDVSGKNKKFIWLHQIDSSIDLFSNYKDLKSKSVKIIYTEQEYFDPNIDEYRVFNVIIKIQKLKDSSNNLISQR